jgi:hypothetical protein
VVGFIYANIIFTSFIILIRNEKKCDRRAYSISGLEIFFVGSWLFEGFSIQSMKFSLIQKYEEYHNYQ